MSSKGGELECGFGLRAGQGIDVAGFGQPARAAFVEQDVPFVPHARVVVHLQTADDVERGRAVAAARADLQRAEVFQQGGVAAFVDNAAVLAYQHAVAVTADQRNRSGGNGRVRVRRSLGSRYGRRVRSWSVFPRRAGGQLYGFGFQTASLYAAGGCLKSYSAVAGGIRGRAARLSRCTVRPVSGRR